MIFPVFAGMVRSGQNTSISVSPFSPYSRGWSRCANLSRVCSAIFPVFAGMVLSMATGVERTSDFPRIRGDGPVHPQPLHIAPQFSPYSRGWSARAVVRIPSTCIFPVFAGMVRVVSVRVAPKQNFPRIRGDGPACIYYTDVTAIFSPYSRGWSPSPVNQTCSKPIFPVFAGMVPEITNQIIENNNSPRIRGDDPSRDSQEPVSSPFSPYSRG